MKEYFTFQLLLFFFSQAIAEDAKQYYNEGKFEEAKLVFSQLEKGGLRGSELYYNIAMCHYKLAEYPSAILYFEKALKWRPGCDPCRQMLSVAQKSAGIDLYMLPENWFVQIYFSIINQFPTLFWFGIGVLLICFCLYLKYFKRNPGLEIKIPFIKSVLLATAVLSLMLAMHKEYLFLKTDQFILMSPTALKKSPDPISPDIQQLEAGMKLKKKLQLGTWIKVQTSEYDSGWVPADKLAAIEL